jgi:hypothetical protein
LGYTKTYRKLAIFFNWIVAITLIVISMIGMIMFKAKSDELSREYSVNYICPEDSLEIKKEAYEDQVLQNPEDRLGLMHCFCYQYVIEFGSVNVNFSEFEPEKTVEETQYCYQWA